MCPDLRLFDDVEQKSVFDSAVNTTIVESTNVPVKSLPGGSAAASARGCLITRTDLATHELGAAGSRASDASLVQLALSALAQNALVPGGKVRSVVRNGWLILEGEVEARTQRQAAEDAVRGLPGMRGVSNNILIESEVMARRVSRKIDEAFIRNARQSANRISVTAANHKIILCGSVQSGVEREEAAAAAAAVPGVAHVVNRIRARGGEG